MSNYNIKIDQGATFSLSLTIKENNVPKNLSGYNGGRGQLRSKKESTEAILLTVTITDAAAGTVSISLTAAETAAIEAGLYYYDIELYTNGIAQLGQPEIPEVVDRILRGKANVSREITR